ncbi:K+/H+ antiporter subunit F [Phaeobacter inhibens]|uniref:Monovalent cation/proton antiporter subunit F n=3 Tax=Phaeobacter TaxID=302485 RepID=A0AAC9ZA11_9RHOB|nr:MULTISPECIES: K+/H+ antiporter subunit F [Phaeobacter]AFO87228.1 monovalent cation/proton antiporter subunit F [Phaeobacter inhibens 2.10]AFO90940.1 monovalent cation/proton antiporter subunit F [Phaeobacter inhibens DSM 17395]AHD09931.1 multisubunit potassium/proton antiporter, PhaF subunit [Phaeobacter gallaeciensis DSM 26640]APX14420.1 K+/H+ antiporter subunit F [Phaeobacter inhibens]ATE93195.1 monovalent cation/proton antiporter subunit F [Phaeobacter gallaeciensis]
MIETAAIFAFVCFALSLLMNLWKVVSAEDVADRILALDTMFINAIALMVLYGLALGTEIFFEAAMIIAMLGFVSTVAYARFILRGNIIE